MACPRVLGLGLGLVLTGAAGAAQAGLEICNDTEEFQSVAIGYLGDEGWSSEGWWLIEPGGCVEPLSGDLQQRYYYYRAVVEGVEHEDEGEGYEFCTEPFAFTIVGDTDCEGRGYTTAMFTEIDTGETAVHHVERIVATPGQAPPQVMDDDMPGDDMPEMNDTPPVADGTGPAEDDVETAEGEDVDDFDDFFDDDAEDFGRDMPNMRRGASRL